MRSFLPTLLAAAVLVGPTDQAQRTTFRALEDVVPVYTTVTDSTGRLVPTLTSESFRIFDNGQEQPITLFDNTPQPIHLVVMIDVSGSMSGNLEVLRAACQYLFSQLGQDDRARVGLFGRSVSISPSFTRDLAELTAALPAQIDALALTPLWSGVDQAITALHEITGRRVVVVLSDGRDNPPDWTSKRLRQSDIVAHAQRDDVMLYGIGLLSDTRPGSRMSIRPDPGLATAVLDTGGGYFEISPVGNNLPASFARFASEVHSQYLLGFSPQVRDGRTHQLEVRVTSPLLVARARKSYLAPTD